MKRIYAALLSLALIIPHTGFARDELPAIYISEINWGGSERSNADEWIELYNRTDQEVDLGGWVLTGVASGGDAIALAEGTIIRAESTLLIANYAGSSEKTTLLVEPDLVTTSLSLSNSGLVVMLAGPDGTVVDEVHADDWDAGGTNPFVSMERTEGGWRSAELSANLLDEQIGTPGVHIDESVVNNSEDTLTEPCSVEQQEVVEEPDNTLEPEDDQNPNDTTHSDDTPIPATPVATQLKLSELVSNPQEGGEWVELVHESDTPALLDGWRLEDAGGKRTLLEGEIGATTLMVIYLPNQILNNSGDSLQLIDPNGVVVDQTDYSEDPPQKGESWSFVNAAWQRTPPTPEAFNEPFPEVIEEEDQNTDETTAVDDANTPSDTLESNAMESQTHTIVAVAEQNQKASSPEPSTGSTNTASSKSIDDSKGTSVEGVITAEPGLFGSQIAFLEGYQLYFYHADWPSLPTGTRVRVQGEESTSRGEQRLKIASKEDIEVLGSEPEHPTSIHLAELSQYTIGTLVTVEAEAIERDGKTLTIDQQGAIADVVFHDGMDVDLKTMLGKTYQITGVVRTLNGTVRIYPRSKADLLELISEETVTDTASGTVETITPEPATKELYLGVAFLAAAASATGYFAFRHYAPKLKMPVKQPFKTLKITTVN